MLLGVLFKYFGFLKLFFINPEKDVSYLKRFYYYTHTLKEARELKTTTCSGFV